MSLFATALVQLSGKHQMLLRHLVEGGVVVLEETSPGKQGKAFLGNCANNRRFSDKFWKDPEGVFVP